MTARTAARTQLPETWEPSPEDIAAAEKALAGSGLTISNELEKFRDYHMAHGSLMGSWGRAFRYWCRQAPGFAPKGFPRPNNGAQGHGDMTAEQKAELRRWHEERGMHVPLKARH